MVNDEGDGRHGAMGSVVKRWRRARWWENGINHFGQKGKENDTVLVLYSYRKHPRTVREQDLRDNGTV